MNTICEAQIKHNPFLHIFFIKNHKSPTTPANTDA
jgi:hypothetical protein